MQNESQLKISLKTRKQKPDINNGIYTEGTHIRTYSGKIFQEHIVGEQCQDIYHTPEHKLEEHIHIYALKKHTLGKHISGHIFRKHILVNLYKDINKGNTKRTTKANNKTYTRMDTTKC